MDLGRAAGELQINDEDRATLALFRIRHWINKAPLLELDAVQAVETKLHKRIHDAVWAWLAAAGRDPHQLLTLTADGREEYGLPRRFVAFDCDRSKRSYCCVERGSFGLLRCPVWVWDGHHAMGRWPSVASFVRGKHNMARGPLAHGAFDGERDRFQAELAALRPALVRASSSPVGSAEVHAAPSPAAPSSGHKPVKPAA